MGALCNPGHWTLDAHGDVETCVEVKLVDFPDAGYFSTNKPKPQGEIWVRGESIMKGYVSCLSRLFSMSLSMFPYSWNTVPAPSSCKTDFYVGITRIQS